MFSRTRAIRKLAALLFAWLALSASTRAEEVPSPEQRLGFEVGSDRNLADWGQIVDYFQTLSLASARVRVETIGRTTEDNPFLLATISAPENLADLNRLQRIQERLADPRRLEGQAEQLIREGKTVVLITCGIHATEVASSQMSMEFAWEMATGEDGETREILNNVVFLLVPSLNPDGLNIVARWYRETLGTPAEGTSPPELYQKYVGHDNNRDWFMFTQKETRLTVGKIHNRWHPQIVYDVHQMGANAARMFVPPFVDPVEPNVDTILQAEIVDLGGWMFSRLIGAGRKGVVTNAIYDAFTPARAYQHYHAGVRILSESASAKLATPITVQWEDLRPGRNYDSKSPSWNFPEPWPGGLWRVRDIVEDQKIALKACLLHAARNRENWLRNFLQVGERNLGRASPFAFLVPPAVGQRDPLATLELLQTLEFAQVEIDRATAAFSVQGAVSTSTPFGEKERAEFPEGTFIVYLKQPYGSFAKAMLEVQRYPELREFPGGPLKRPYDVTAHTLGMQMGVEVYQVDEPFAAESSRAVDISIPDGTIEGEGNYWLFSHTSNAFAKLANRLLKAGRPLYWAPNGFRLGDGGHPAGTLMTRVDGEKSDLTELLKQVPINIKRVKKQPELAWRRIKSPRVGIYKSWTASIDEGWTRWILEEYEFPYRSLSDGDMRQADLGEFDVIVIPDQSPKSLKEGLGDPYPERYRGGLTDVGVDRLKNFAREGGTLVFLGEASLLPLADWGIGVRDRLEGLADADFFIPGSLLRGNVNNRHPLGYGMPEETALMFVRSQAFDLTHAVSVVDYPERAPLLSGWQDGAFHLGGASGLAEVPFGKGSLVLVGFRTQFRAQARATYKFLFNALYQATVR